MPLTLTPQVAGADIAAIPPLRLDGRGAVIGRSPDADWRLPDPRSLVSSRHCEIAHRDGVYVLVDSSTNGTFVNGQRLSGPHRLVQGDVIGIGDFRIAVALDTARAGMPPQPPVAARPSAAMRPAGPTALGPSVSAPISADGFTAFLTAAGIDRAQIRADEATTLAAAGGLLRRLVTAFRTMDEDRVRARAEIGAAAAPVSGGANPIARAQSPEQALALLLGPPQTGVVPASQAVDDVSQSLETHRRAVLKAMQAGLSRSLEKVSPAAVRARATSPGLLARLLPGGGDAALWRDYEKGFDPAATVDTAFIEMFAEEFRRAYEDISSPKSQTGTVPPTRV